jgi:hypothetical protein
MRDVLWTVYSRLGEKVFEARSLDAVWDGTHRGQLLNPGVFVLHLQYTDQETGISSQHISSVTLVH